MLVTGGAGFIGSNFVRYILNTYSDDSVVVLDKLTYAGNLDNLRDVWDDTRFRFVRGDIADARAVDESFTRSHGERVKDEAAAGVNAIVNFAADTHVDRSLIEPGSFITTDVFGTYVLLEAARKYQVGRYVQVSTDEVYGSVESGSSFEKDRLEPRSPYSASKAGGDHMVHAYHVSFGVPALITRASNNFGPYQYPEKLIPLFVTNALEGKPLPVYGDGLNVRDWLYVLDHCRAIDLVLRQGTPGEVYNIGGGNERTNIEITHMVLDLLGKPRSLITHVADRPGHDRRYSLDCSKLKSLGWQPLAPFDRALADTVRWYVENEAWWKTLKSGEYAEYYRRNYDTRTAGKV